MSIIEDMRKTHRKRFCAARSVPHPICGSETSAKVRHSAVAVLFQSADVHVARLLRCGVNLEEVAANNLERVEADLRRLQELRSACRFDEAMALLVRLTKNEHPSLAEYVTRAKQLILDLGAERDQRRTEAEEDCQLARERFAAFDVDSGAELLEGVPPPSVAGRSRHFGPRWRHGGRRSPHSTKS